jgi:hypothetical protein
LPPHGDVVVPDTRRGRDVSTRRGCRNASSEAGMQPAAIVVTHPLPQELAEVSFMERDHPIQTFPGAWCRSPVRRTRRPA